MDIDPPDTGRPPASATTEDHNVDKLFDQVQEQLQELGLCILDDKNYAVQRPYWLEECRSYTRMCLDQRAKGDDHAYLTTHVQKSICHFLRSPGPRDPRPLSIEATAFRGDFIVTKEYEAFLAALKDVACRRTEEWYARVLPVIQSSGTGKSRMLDQAAKSVFTFPISLRDLDQENCRAPLRRRRAHTSCSDQAAHCAFTHVEYAGYPPSDVDVENCLHPSFSSEARFYRFLKYLLRTALDRLSDKPDLVAPSKWRAYLQERNNRTDFYSRVRRFAEEEKGPVNYQQLDDDVAALFQELVNQLESPYFVIYIDKAHALDSFLIQRILRVMSELAHKRNHVLVLCSAHSEISKLPLEARPGYFGSDQTLGPQPWTRFPFTVFNMAPPQGNPWTPAHARSFEASAKLGRPLWGALLTNSLDPQQIAKIAFRKLSGLADVNQKPMLAHLKAALLCRLFPGIDSERPKRGTPFDSTLTAKHMATALFLVKKDRTAWGKDVLLDRTPALTAACYCVEPILAWAAFQIMQRSSSACFMDCMTQLTQEGLIGRFERGQLITKLALTTAYDKVLQRTYQSDDSYESVSRIPHYSSVSLQAFMAALGGRTDLLDALDSSGCVSLRELKDCSTVLAQWTGSKVHESTLNPDLAAQAMRTHCGVQMAPNWSGIDYMVVFSRDKHQPIAPSNLLVLFCQSQSRSQGEKVQVPRRVIDRFTQHEIPVIFILHEVEPEQLAFGMTRYEKPVTFTEDTVHDKATMPGAPIWCFEMSGMCPHLVKTEAVRDLVKMQRQPAWVGGWHTEDDVLSQLPMLCNDPTVRERIWSEEKGLFTQI